MAIGSLNDNAWSAYDYLQKKYGYTPEQAAGVVGNLMQESTFMTNARNAGDGRDGSDSIGIAQWNGPRAKALMNFASSNNADPNSLNTQLDFFHHEFSTDPTYAKQYAAFQNASSPADAASAVIGFERPRGWSANNPTNGDGWGNRLSWANQAFGNSRDGSQPAPVGTLGPISAGSSNPQVATASNPTATPTTSSPEHSGGLLGLNKDGKGLFGWDVANNGIFGLKGGKDTAAANPIGKLFPTGLLGDRLGKEGKLLGGLGDMMQKEADTNNAVSQRTAQAGLSRRAQAQEVQPQLTQSLAMPANGLGAMATSAPTGNSPLGPTASGGMDPELMRKLMMMKMMQGNFGRTA